MDYATFTRALTIVFLSSSLCPRVEAAKQERTLAVFQQQSTTNLLVVNDKMRVKEYDFKTRRIQRFFESPQRLPGRLLGGGFQPSETFKIQRSIDERWLAAAFEPEGSEDEKSTIALQIIIWDCQTGRIVHRSAMPQDSTFGHNFPGQLDFVLTDEWKLLYLKMFDKLLVWDIEKSEYIRKHHIGYSTNYYFDQRKSRIAWTQQSKLVLRDSRSDEFLQEISLSGYIAEKPLFLKDGRIVFAAFADESDDARLTSPYPLLVCYDTTRRRVLWRQAFDTTPGPSRVSPDGSQLLIGVGGGVYQEDLKLPIIDQERIVNQKTWDGRVWSFPWYSACTVDLKDGSNRVYRYKGDLFSGLMSAQYSGDGKQLAYIVSTGMGDKANYASLVKSSDWKEIATVNLLGKNVDKLLVLHDDQGLLLWSKFGSWILHWNPSTNRLTQNYPETILPAIAEKP